MKQRGVAFFACVVSALSVFIVAAPLKAAVLTDGPLVGAVDQKSAKVFGRTDVEADVQIQYHAESGPCSGVVTTDAVTTKLANDYTAIVDLTGLCPATKYVYNILVNGVAHLPSPEPSFVSFPEPTANVPFEFAALADLRGSFTAPPVPAPVYGQIRNDDPAFVVQVGDFDHRDPQGLENARMMHREVRGATTPSGLDFLENIAWNYPLFHIWDDHDVGRDNADKRFAGLTAARRAFQEYYPTPTLPNPNNGLWHSFRYGQAEFFVLDLRSQRDPDYDVDTPEHSMLDGDNIPNGQKEWFKNGLLTSTARWKFIVSSVPFNKNSGKRDDSWMGFMIERNELVDFIKGNGIEGVIIFSGDVHSGGMIDDGLNSDFPEISVPHTNLEQLGPNPCSGVGCRDFWSVGTIGGFEVLGGYAYFIVETNPDQVTIQAKDSEGVVRLQYVVTAPTATTDLSLTGTDSPDPVLLGSNLTYTLTARNDGPSAGSNVVLTETLPGSVTLVSATPSQGSCSGTGVVSCSLGSLAIGATATVTIVVTPTLEETLTATTSVVASEFDPDSADNSMIATTTVLAADLVESVSSPPPSTTVGAILSVTDRARNKGTGTAGASTTRYYMSADTARDAGDALMPGSRSVPALVPDGQSLGTVDVTVPVVPGGPYYLLACSDDLGAVVESLEGNNCQSSSTTVFVTATGGVDLAITSSDSPDPVTIGTNLTLTGVATNLGPNSATNAVVTVTLPASVAFVSSSTTRGTCSGTGPVTCSLGTLANGAGATVTVVVSPITIETVTATLAVVANEADSNGANNSAVTTTIVVAPDLVESVGNPPGTANAGTSFSLTDRARNNGTASAGTSMSRYYMSPDTEKSADDRLMGGTRSVPVLAPNAQSVGTLDVTVPFDMVAGTYYVLGCVDDTLLVIESLEGNNCRASATTVIVPTSLNADVSVTLTDAPDPVAVGGTLTYTAVAKNLGPNGATNVVLTTALPVNVAFGSVSTTKGSCSGTATVTCTIGSLSIGVTATVTIVVTPSLEETLTAVGTVSASEFDGNTANNTSSATTTVIAPDLVESVSSPPATAQKGTSFSVTDRARNKGTGSAGVSTTRYYVSLDTTKNAGDALLTGTRAIPVLAAGDQSLGTISVTIPTSVATGTYYLLACADDTGLVVESLEGNNCQASTTTVAITP